MTEHNVIAKSSTVVVVAEVMMNRVMSHYNSSDSKIFHHLNNFLLLSFLSVYWAITAVCTRILPENSSRCFSFTADKIRDTRIIQLCITEALDST